MKERYYNEADGHTYYLKGSELYACPTMKDGSIQLEAELLVADFDEPLSEEQNINILFKLMEVKKLDGSDEVMKAVCGTSLVGSIEVSYFRIKEVFGMPSSDGDDYKTDAEWYIQTPEGVATLYNYKSGKNYNDDGGGLPTSKITDWHIGGKTEEVVKYIEQALLK